MAATHFRAAAPADGPGPGIWSHYEGLGIKEAGLCDRLGIPADWVRDSLDEYQRARFQRQGDLALLILICPRTAVRRPEPFATTPLGIVLAPDRVYSIALRDPDVIGDLRRADPPPSAGDPVAFAIAALAANEQVYRDELRQIHERSTMGEEELKESLTGDRLAELIDQGRSLAYFLSALSSNQRMLGTLRDDGFAGRDEETRAAFDEVVERNDENAQLAEVFMRIHGDLMDGFSSLVSMNLNALVRTLTEITIALAVPAIIAAMWGMNVALPLEEHDLAFGLITLVIIVLGVAAFLVIRFGERFGLRLGRRS